MPLWGHSFHASQSRNEEKILSLIFFYCLLFLTFFWQVYTWWLHNKIQIEIVSIKDAPLDPGWVFLALLWGSSNSHRKTISVNVQSTQALWPVAPCGSLRNLLNLAPGFLKGSSAQWLEGDLGREGSGCDQGGPASSITAALTECL